jgi:uncharacterized protein DUF2017
VNPLRAKRAGDAVLLEAIPPALAAVLRELPEHLGPDLPHAARRRLLPDPSDDEAIAAEWRIRQHPELLTLLADARRIVETDLAALAREGRRMRWRLEIPASHVDAWISALNAARLALGAHHGVTAAQMDRDFVPGDDEASLALLRIDLYGWLQGTLIELVSPES